jgi:hypothetical protein
MATLSRLAGAILAITGDQVFLVGRPKVPCDWRSHGLLPPEHLEAIASRWLRLQALAPPVPEAPVVIVQCDGEALPQLASERFLIDRTGMVSERLWRLVVGQGEDDEPMPVPVIDAGWLADIPSPIWQVVRDAVLRCS